MKILLSIPIHGEQRRWLFDNVIAPALPRMECIMPLLIGDCQQDRQLAQKWGLYYTEHPNKPLGSKFNRGSLVALKYDCDYMIIMGSDDIIGAGVIEAMIDQKSDYVGWEDLYFYDYKSKKTVYWPGYSGPRKGESIGLGRMVSRKLIRACGGKMWDDDKNRGLDGSMTRKLKGIDAKVLSLKERGLFMCDIKGFGNLWPFSHFDYKEAEIVSNDIIDGYLC